MRCLVRVRSERLEGVFGGVWLMGQRKHRSRDWHHRVPDFKLVYCGPKKKTLMRETEQKEERRRVEVSVSTNENGAVMRKLEKQK